jgi:hypothetical protein
VPVVWSRELAAAVASKVFFHLEEYEDALRLGLGAGPYLDVSKKTEYVETMVAKAIDEYVKLKERQDQGGDDVPLIDPRLEAIVDKMFVRCVPGGWSSSGLAPGWWGVTPVYAELQVFQRWGVQPGGGHCAGILPARQGEQHGQAAL